MENINLQRFMTVIFRHYNDFKEKDSPIKYCTTDEIYNHVHIDISFVIKADLRYSITKEKIIYAQ